uniref:Uncharacterized protein n=1 Tax=Peronospora matthiolae TaxID=2874970 RepID=A0AAV1UHX6_9STRA
MSTPGLKRARHPHPVDSVATTRVTTLVPHYLAEAFRYNVPEWCKGVDSSSTVFALVGSNPTADT